MITTWRSPCVFGLGQRQTHRYNRNMYAFSDTAVCQSLKIMYLPLPDMTNISSAFLGVLALQGMGPQLEELVVDGQLTYIFLLFPSSLPWMLASVNDLIAISGQVRTAWRNTWLWLQKTWMGTKFTNKSVPSFESMDEECSGGIPPTLFP